MQCRTAALGGHVHACPGGHISRIWSNSCRQRSGPQCTSLQTERWLALQRARLLACDHDPVRFPLPHDRNPLWLANVPVMSTLLCQAARDRVSELLADAKYLGAQPGMSAAWHPWSQTLGLHPHVPCLGTGGGLPLEGHWKALRNGLLLPVRVVMAVFRGKMLAAMRQAWMRGELALPEALRPQQLLHRLNRLGQAQTTPWNVHMRERYRHGAGGVTSLARDLRGGPLKNARLVAWDGERVTCTYRAHAAGARASIALRQRMTLASGEVSPTVVAACASPTDADGSLLWAVPAYPHGGFGVLPGAGGPAPVVVPVVLAWQTACAQRGDAHPERCPACGQLLGCTGIMPRGGAPPPALARERAA
jgi:hypothetical protein